MPDIAPDRFPKTRLSPLAQALVIMDLRHETTPAARGAKLVSIRRSVAAGSHDDHAAALRYRSERRRLQGVTLADLPASQDDIWLMIEALSQRLGQVGHHRAWEYIGVVPTRGREYLTRASDRVDWPVFFTLRHNALGK